MKKVQTAQRGLATSVAAGAVNPCVARDSTLVALGFDPVAPSFLSNESLPVKGGRSDCAFGQSMSQMHPQQLRTLDYDGHLPTLIGAWQKADGMGGRGSRSVELS